MQVSYDRLHITKKSIATEGDLTFRGGEFVVVANWPDTVKKNRWKKVLIAVSALRTTRVRDSQSSALQGARTSIFLYFTDLFITRPTEFAWKERLFPFRVRVSEVLQHVSPRFSPMRMSRVSENAFYSWSRFGCSYQVIYIGVNFNADALEIYARTWWCCSKGWRQHTRNKIC